MYCNNIIIITILPVLNRIKGRFENTQIRLEHPSVNGIRGIAIIINIGELFYKNETGTEHISKEVRHPTKGNDCSENDLIFEHVNYLPTYAKHTIIINGLQLNSEEFIINKKSTNTCNACGRRNCDGLSVPILKVQSNFKVQIKLKQSEQIQGPKVCLDFEIGKLFGTLSPRQLHLVSKIIHAFQSEELGPNSSSNILRRCDDLELQSKHENDMTKLNTSIYWGEQGSYFYDNMTCDSLSTSMTSSQMSGVSRLQPKFSNMEKSGDILNLYLKASSISFILLEKDILEEEVHKNCCPISDEYINIVNSLFSTFKDCDEHLKPLSTCTHNHLYLQLYSLSADIAQQRIRNSLNMKVSASVTKVNAFEVIDGEMNSLIHFSREVNEIYLYLLFILCIFT